MTSISAFPSDALLPFIATLALKITLLLGGAFLASRWLASAAAGVRHLIWAWGLAGCLALPLLQLAIPPLEWKILPAPTQLTGPAVDVARQGNGLNSNARKVRSVSTSPSADGHAASDPGFLDLSPLGLQAGSSLLAAYWVVSVGLVAYLLLGLWRLYGLRRQSRPPPLEGEWESLLNRLRRDLGMNRPVVLRFSGRIETPIAWGVLRPVVLLPDSAERWAPSLRTTVLVHELTHLKSLHWLSHLLGRLACCLYWPHPFVWMGARRLSLEGERSCDDRVILSGARPSLYARQLLALSSRGAGILRLPTPALPIVRRTQIQRRIESILEPRKRRTVMKKTTALGMSILAAILLSTLAAASLGAAEPRPQAVTERSQIESRQAPTDLLRAIDEGDRDRVAALLRQGADVNQVVSGSRTPLIRAAFRGDEAMVRLLLQSGADPRLTDRGRSRQLPEIPRSALGAAAVSGNREVVNLLLSAGVAADFTPRGDASPLMLAAAQGHGHIVELLIGAGAEANQEVRGEGSALMHAAASGDLSSAISLIDAGADVNARIRGDGSPLIAAAAAGQDEIVELLLDRGADPNMEVRGDGTPLTAALDSGNQRTVGLLLARGANPNSGVRGDPSPIAQAAKSGDLDIVAELLEGGADPGLHFRGDPNALMMAASRGDLQVLDVLIRAGADPNTAARGDGNALIAAARAGRLDAADYLLDSGSDPNGFVVGDGSALIAAARRNDLSMVDLLLSRGANVNLIVEGDENALINAAQQGHIEVASVLIEAGADINAVVREGNRTRTALSEALRSGHAEMADFLRRRGAIR